MHTVVQWMVLEYERRDAVAKATSVLKDVKQPHTPILDVLSDRAG